MLNRKDISMIRTLAAAVLGLVLTGYLVPVDGLAQDRVPADQATTTQKAQLVENLVTNSVSASRIEQSGDQEAIESLKTARALVAKARDDLSRNNFDAADDKLNRALELVNSNTQRLSGAAVQGARDREAYERRRHAVGTFLGAYQRVANAGGDQSVSRQAARIEALSGDAEALAIRGNYAEAIDKLDEAYAVARGDIREMRDGKTLTRTLDFATAREEYDYELGRNRSHFLLLEFAFSEKNPQGSVLGRIKGNKSDAEGLRREAESLAGKGDHATAIDKLNESTAKLVQAIRMSGVFVP